MTAKQQPASAGLTQVGGVAGVAEASAAKPRALVFQTWAMVVVAYLSFCRQLGSHTRRGKGSERCGDESAEACAVKFAVSFGGAQQSAFLERQCQF
jgi:hypothetical protein